MSLGWALACDAAPTSTPEAGEPTAQELHEQGEWYFEHAHYEDALEAFRRAHAVAEGPEKDLMLHNIAVAAARAGNCTAATEALIELGGKRSDVASSARKHVVAAGCAPPDYAAAPRSGAASSGRTGPPSPPAPANTDEVAKKNEVAGAIGEDDVFVSEVHVQHGDPFAVSGGAAGDFEYSCYLGNGSGVTAMRHVYVGASNEVEVHPRPGSSGAGKRIELPGGPVVVKKEVVLSVTRRAYLVTKSGTCSCPSELCMTERPVTARFEEGDVIESIRGDVIGDMQMDETDICSFGDAQVECADDSWLSERDAECFRRHVTPLSVRAPKDVVLGWWVELEQGWVHADGKIELQVQCDGECETRVEQCLDELGCYDGVEFSAKAKPREACAKKCEKLHADCKPEWRSAQLGG